MAIRTGDGDTRAGTASGLSDAACTSSHVIDYLREAVPLLLGGTEAQLYDTLIRATELAEQCVSRWWGKENTRALHAACWKISLAFYRRLFDTFTSLLGVHLSFHIRRLRLI